MDDQSHEDVEAARGPFAVGAAQCPEMTRKALKGVALTLLIAMAYVGSLHLIKLSFDYQPRPLPTSGVSVGVGGVGDDLTLENSNEETDDDFFNASNSESTVQPIPVSCTPNVAAPEWPLKSPMQCLCNAHNDLRNYVCMRSASPSFDVSIFSYANCTPVHCFLWPAARAGPLHLTRALRPHAIAREF